ncbi:MAG TPA: hypothetical protein VFW40_08920, partial [Capsulimonadaceae bacterium]|nr:hypothetical protein [Capsulimonadaceae bacterium]
MSGSTSDPIIRLILDNIGLIVIIVVGVLGAIGKAIKGPSRPPSGPAGPPLRPTATAPPRPAAMAPPVTMPHAASSPSLSSTGLQGTQRPPAQPKFRAQAPALNRPKPTAGSSADQIAQERAEIERFVQEEKELEA